jgi:hypothetical protein
MAPDKPGSIPIFIINFFQKVLQDMKVCGYNVLPIVTDCLNLYKAWTVGSGRAGYGAQRLGTVGHGKARADNSRLSILKSAPSSVRHGRARIGTVRRGGARLDKERYGMELATVDRAF